jgi:hypothetical protein
VNGWKRSGRGAKARLVASLEAQEAAVLRGLVGEIRQILAGRADDNPADELAILTGMRTGPSTRPTDRVLARLLPDFTTEDTDLAAGLRSLHEPELIEAKDSNAAWLASLNDVRLALGTALDVSEDMPEQLPSDDPRATHMGVYHWLTFVQDALVQTRMQVR